MYGFTMIELIGTLVIVAILAAVTIPRFFDRNTFDARSFTDQTKSMLRYAQKVAIAQHRKVFVILDKGANPHVALCFDAACSAGNLVPAPGRNNSGSNATLAACGGGANKTWFCEAPPSGIVLSNPPATTTFYFSELGKPFNTDATDLSTLLIRITGDGANHDISVEQETGYVHS
jgi:MSHA pilin protein MshC